MRHPLLETFPLDHPERIRVEREFGLGKMERVEHAKNGPLGHCYWNVDDEVRLNGGEMVLGWQILQWPGLFVQALHHALWKTPDGQLFDVTVKYATDKQIFSTFIIDDSQKINLEVPVFIETHYVVLNDVVPVQNLIGRFRSQLDHKRKLVKAVVDAGARVHPKNGMELTPELFSRFQSEIEKTDGFESEVSAAMIQCAKITR
jgi:hypothetical protein